MELKKFQKVIEAINTYYAFALLLYALTLYVTSHSYLFLWIFLGTTPILTGWGGYLLYGVLQRRNERHGFRILSDIKTYEMAGNNKYILRYTTTIKAGTNHLMSYPIGHRWTGTGREEVPKVTGKGQQLLGHINKYNPTKGTASIEPYRLTSTTEADWHFWFIALNPPSTQR